MEFTVSTSGGGVRQATILLVEDNPADARLTLEALREGGVHSELYHAPDGVEALAFLQRQGSHAAAPRPDLILLDLNMPRKGGREVLAELKENPDFRNIPVVVLTSSTAEQDIRDVYSLNGNCYIKKPVDFAEFFDNVCLIMNFWLTVVTLPSRSRCPQSEASIAA
jgi:two-component system, chemotaxis family, response regulator Rcp1